MPQQLEQQAAGRAQRQVGARPLEPGMVAGGARRPCGVGWHASSGGTMKRSPTWQPRLAQIGRRAPAATALCVGGGALPARGAAGARAPRRRAERHARVPDHAVPKPLQLGALAAARAAAPRGCTVHGARQLAGERARGGLRRAVRPPCIVLTRRAAARVAARPLRLWPARDPVTPRRSKSAAWLFCGTPAHVRLVPPEAQGHAH